MAIDPNNLSTTATLTFSEDFNSFNLWNGNNGLDTRPGWAMWPQFDNGFTEAGNGEQEWFIQPGDAQTASVNPFSVQNGVLTISANPTPSSMLPYVNNQPYTSGWVDTYHEFSQTYGYFEMRAELPAGQGLWPAFWLLPEDNSWPPEIDVMEMIGSQPNTLATTVHSQDPIAGGREISSNHFATGAGTYEPGMTTGFHTYGVDLEAATITWYFDGQEVFQTPTPPDLQNKPVYMIADLAVGGSWPGNPDSTTRFPAQMEIDYLRAYQAAPQSSSGGSGGNQPPSGNNTGGTSTDPPPTGNTTTVATSAGPDDVLWRNEADGTLANWAMNGAQVVAGQEDTFQGAVAAPNADWNVAGIGDFNADGHADILWRNLDGNLIDWIMNGSQIASSQAITSQGNTVAPGASWSVAGTGDFSGDGASDILWRNTNGTLIDWAMDGSAINSSQDVTLNGAIAAPDASWSIAAIGDLNDDGHSNILWRNADGALTDWTMNGSQIGSTQEITLEGHAATPDASWSVAAVGDFKGDGRSEILWRDTNGTLMEWTLQGAQITSSQQVTFQGHPASPDSSWQVAQIGNFNGNGTSDILWRNSTGALVEWTMNGAQITAMPQVTTGAGTANPSSNWTTIAKPTDFF
ncbi:MAG: family 16 glycosylhydrolase [Acidobacteriaceae bacterium]|nr:family 16 glycosylhydrolase [Acidobacteriaceae bacterium]MBV9754868.1 family 16 glycosylhydrolase [Hyphomicrobiales bacterium]